MKKCFTTEQWVECAKKVHSNKYDYSKVNYIDSRHKVCIICPEHGEFWQKANSHLMGSGCKKCAMEKLSNSQRMTKEQFIEKAKKIHGNKYDYSKVEYKNTDTKVCIICPEHGEFWQTPSAHVYLKESCEKCSKSHKYSTEEWIELAKKIHGNKYDYSKVEYKNAFTKICIICPEHGEFWQRPNSHISGIGCPKCSYKEKKVMYSLTNEEFIEKAKKIHGDKYDYSKINYKGSREKVCIICPEHGEFWQTPSGHIYNFQGCPFCKKSKMENYTRLLLSESNIKFEEEKEFDWLIYENNMRLDFLCGNMAIECQGGQHFIPVKKYGGIEGLNLILKRDKLKYEQCKNNGIDILYIIPYRYKNNEIFKTFYVDKKYIFFNELNDKLIKQLREVL